MQHSPNTCSLLWHYIALLLLVVVVVPSLGHNSHFTDIRYLVKFINIHPWKKSFYASFTKIDGDSIRCFKVDVTLITNTYNIRRATKFLYKVLNIFQHQLACPAPLLFSSRMVTASSRRRGRKKKKADRTGATLNTCYQSNSLIKLPMKYSLVLKSGYGGW